MERDNFLVLENKALRLEILPQFGGNLFRIFHKPSSTEILWNKAAPSRKGGFDNSWFGGLDVMFPNDVFCGANGFSYPDHGVIWDKAMTYELRDQSITLFAECARTACKIEITVALNGTAVDLQTVISHTGQREMPYLFRFHPAFLLDDGDQLLLKPHKCHVDPLSNSKAALHSVFTWPKLPMADGETLDMGIVDSRHTPREIFHHYELDESWFTIYRRKKAIEVVCIFGSEMRYLTYYGALRTLHDANICVLEPATSIPATLEEAIVNKTVKYLKPGETAEFRMTLHII